MSECYDRDGRPLELLDWARKSEDKAYKQVAYDEFPGGRVSTVWLGLDHGWGGELEIFETMVFGGPLNEEQVRYATLEEAEKGHVDMLQRARIAAEQQVK